MWEGRDEDSDWVRKFLEDKNELKNCGRLGSGPNDVRKIDMLGRVIELTHEGITWRGDPRHCDLLQEYFGMDEWTQVLIKNGYESDPEQRRSGRWRSARRFRMLAARLNSMAQDNPWCSFLQGRSAGTWQSDA